MLKPQSIVSNLKVSLVGGEEWVLSEQTPENFTFIFFYRGKHCPICRQYLLTIEKSLQGFSALGIDIVAMSTDTRERAESSKQEWGLKQIPIGYGVSIDEARSWGLFISIGIKGDEPDIFAEPGLFIIKPNGELYASSVQTMPFTRPAIDELLSGFKYIIANGYPGRGEA